MKVWINGANGLVGKSLLHVSQKYKKFEIVSTSREDLDLFDLKKIKAFIQKNKPEYLIHCAAKVGGIYANQNQPFDYIYENNIIQNNIITIVKKFNFKKVINLGSSCVYPKIENRKIRESDLLTKTLEKSNEFYAIAKINSLKSFEALSKQYNKNILNVMPTNVYGPFDRFNNENSHVIPAIISKIHNAKLKNLNFLELWGTGNPKREFIYSYDLAEILLKLLKTKTSKYELLNIGSGQEFKIKQISEKISKIIGYKGKIKFNGRVGDGPFKKRLNLNKLNKKNLNLNFTSIEDGLKNTIKYYQNLSTLNN